MENKKHLVERLKNTEDGFTERKPKGVSTEDICKTLVAFANSLDEGQEGLLFIGVSNSGVPLGIDDADGRQKAIRRLAEKRCYPPIAIQQEVFTLGGCEILAVTVYASKNKPHFAGPAFVRTGSESVNATETQYNELITSRLSDAHRLLKYRDQGLELLVDRPDPWDQKVKLRTPCKITEVNSSYVVFETGPGQVFSISLKHLSIRWEGSQNKPLVTETP